MLAVKCPALSTPDRQFFNSIAHPRRILRSLGENGVEEPKRGVFGESAVQLQEAGSPESPWGRLLQRGCACEVWSRSGHCFCLSGFLVSSFPRLTPRPLLPCHLSGVTIVESVVFEFEFHSSLSHRRTQKVSLLIVFYD